MKLLGMCGKMGSWILGQSQRSGGGWEKIKFSLLAFNHGTNISLLQLLVKLFSPPVQYINEISMNYSYSTDVKLVINVFF